MNFKRYHVSKNLYNYATNVTGYRIQWTTGNSYADATAIMSDYIPVSAGNYSLDTAFFIVGYDTNKAYVGVYRVEETWEKRSSQQVTLFKVATNSGVAYVKLLSYGDYPALSSTNMLNTGSTALPYEPYSSEVWHDTPYYIRKTDTDTLTLPAVIYGDGTNATVTLKGNEEHTGTPSPQNPVTPQGTGDLETSGEHAGQYKIPILSNTTTYNKYLGEVQTTRKIKKYEFTGQEDWRELSSDTTKHYLTTITPDYLRADSQVTYVSSHYVAYEQTVSAILVPDGNISMASSTTTQRLYIADSTYTTNDAWKAYLAQQYANGTPVTIWYVLATPETGIVNEPLMKIGSYADSLTTSIPTTDGANALSIGTTVQPSEVTAAFHGWHPVANVHEAEDGQWD